MPKLVLKEKGHRRGAKRTTLEVGKSPDHERGHILVESSGEELLSFEVEPVTGRLIVGVAPEAPVMVVDGVSKAPIIARAEGTEKDPEGLRSWSIDEEKGVFKCWLPNGMAVELPIVEEPGPFTPQGHVHEVLGQPELIFAIALGIKLGKHTLLSGPTGIAKTTAYRWIAQQLNYNLVLCPIARGTEAAHMVGEYLPVDEAGRFEWTDGPVTTAVRASQDHPTLLLFDEVNRIGNIAEFSRVYSLLDDTRMLELKEKRDSEGREEVLTAGDLFVGATSNPSDDERADYVGVQDLDPALNSRFALQPKLAYPPAEVEIKALMGRVEGLQEREATAMVECANRIREATNVRFPMSFRELEAWALTLPFFGWKQSAEISMISKAAAMYRADLRGLIVLKTSAAGSTAEDDRG